MSVSDRLRNFDTHSSVSNEFRVYTVQGAVLSVTTVLAISYLLFTELQYNFQTTIKERVHVNATSPNGLNVEFDISLPQIPCHLLNIDANDPTGQAQSLHLDRTHHVWKHRIKTSENGKIHLVGDRTKLELGSTLLNESNIVEAIEEALNITSDGTLDVKRKLDQQISKKNQDDNDQEPELDEDYCGSCYGAGEEDECCNTCDDVKRAYNRRGWRLHSPDSIEQCAREMKEQKDAVNAEDNEGCNVHGVIALSTGGGSFHFAPGRDNNAVFDTEDALTIFDVLLRTFEQFNVSHTVHKIRFGDEYPGHVHQLDGESRTISDSYGMYQYYFQIVPTLYKFLNGTVIQTNQFSVTEHLRHVNPGGGRGLPGVFFFYEISPLHVEIVEEYQRGWIHFFTSICAIVGGVVTVMGLLDQYIFTASNSRNHGATTNGGILAR